MVETTRKSVNYNMLNLRFRKAVIGAIMHRLIIIVLLLVPVSVSATDTLLYSYMVQNLTS
jgi:hypothetical protein